MQEKVSGDARDIRNAGGHERLDVYTVLLRAITYPDDDRQTYQQLLDFITDKRQMRMSHIYQPVMLMTLLQNQGKASTDQIAKEFLIRDQSQIEYYEQITNAMPGRVLGKNHGLVEKAGGEYLLMDFTA